MKTKDKARLMSDLIEEIVICMLCAPRSGSRDSMEKLSLQHFDMAHVMLPEAYLGGTDDRMYLNPEDFEITPATVNGRWDVSVLIISEHDEHWKGERYQLIRSRSVPVKSLRGRYPFYGSITAERAGARIYENGSYEAQKEYHVWKGGRFLTFVDRPPASLRYAETVVGAPIVYDAHKDWAMRMSISAAITHDYEWVVGIGLEGSPRVAFATDPTGVREVFRWRDLPPGKTRREAIIHWVTAHWRQQRPSPADRTWVREHLRGRTDFNWRGLCCCVHPSDSDLRRSQRSAAKDRVGP